MIKFDLACRALFGTIFLMDSFDEENPQQLGASVQGMENLGLWENNWYQDECSD